MWAQYLAAEFAGDAAATATVLVRERDLHSGTGVPAPLFISGLLRIVLVRARDYERSTSPGIAPV